MSYLQGGGTPSDPFVIHNLAAWEYFVANHAAQTEPAATIYYAVLAADIDASGSTVNFNRYWSANLDGNGFEVKGFRSTASSFWGVEAAASSEAIIRRLRIKNPVYTAIGITNGILRQTSGNQWKLEDVEVTGDIGSSSYVLTSFILCVSPSVGPNLTRVFCNLTRINFSNHLATATGTRTDCFNAVNTTFNGATSVYGLSDPYNTSLYTALPHTSWIVDGGSYPRLAIQDTTDATQAYVVKGTTKVGGVVKARLVSGHSPIDMHQFGKTTSAADNGSYLLNCGWYTDHVAVVHRDDYGKLFVASKGYTLGERIHPAIPNGYVYECTRAGTSASEAPTNWPTVGTLTSGSAIFTAQPVYKPETFIAVPVLINLITGLPV